MGLMDIGFGWPAVRGSGGAEEVGKGLGCFPKTPSLILEGGIVEVEEGGVEPYLQPLSECPGYRQLAHGRFS